MDTLTVLLLNWKRPENMRRLLDSLFVQTLRPQVFLWNNGAPLEDDRLDLLVQSSQSLGCWPRWWLASQADSKYLCTIDDDLALKDERVLEDLIQLAQQHGEFGQVFGLEGIVLGRRGAYKTGQRPTGDGPLRNVDIVKGRIMLLHTSAMNQVPLLTDESEDDIAVCGVLAQGRRRFHRQVSWLGGRVIELPQPHAYCRRHGHLRRRNKAAKRFFATSPAAVQHH